MAFVNDLNEYEISTSCFHRDITNEIPDINKK